MRRIKHISLVLTLAPLLFTGCTQDKISRIAPSKLTDSYTQASLSLTEKKLEKKQLVSKSELDKLVTLVKLKLAEKKTVKKEPIKKISKLSKVEQLPLIDPSLVEEIDDTPPPSNIETIDDNLQPFDTIAVNTGDVNTEIDAQESDELSELTRLVSHNLDTDINGIDGVYSTPIVINDEQPSEANKTDNIVKMLDTMKKVKKSSREDEIIGTALSYLDTKYVWAANGPTAFDCSGFTKYVFKKHGITLPRYSGNQAKVGIKVSYNELKVGDLVFFDTKNAHKQKVNHVGIYMGNNKFIHASSAKKKVTITSFKKKLFYKKHFLWGERVIQDDSSYASL